MIRRPPSSTLFPYTTPSRSGGDRAGDGLRRLVGHEDEHARDDEQRRAEGRRAGPPAHEGGDREDRKSTRLNSSHANISYAVFCLKKKTASPARNSPTRPVPS